jgi:tRNA A-37 threonylcarbamoyl transferase component Bud32
LARENKLFLDTSCFLAPTARAALIGSLLPQLETSNAVALVSVRTINSFRRDLAGGQPEERRDAADALEIVAILESKGRLLTAEDPHPISGDKYDTAVLYAELFIGFQHKKGLCLITAIEALALQVLRNSRLGALDNKDGRSTVKGVSAAFIEGGHFCNWVPRLIATSIPPPLPRARRSVDEVELAAGFKVIPDTSALMEGDDRTGELLGAPFFTEQLLPAMKARANRLIVPERVIRELDNHGRSALERPRLQSRAGREALNAFEAVGLLIRGEDENEVLGTSERFADAVFLLLAIRFQRDFPVCFITQDRKLAIGLLANRTAGNEARFFVTYVARHGGRLAHWENRLADNAAKALMEQAADQEAWSAGPPGSQRAQDHARGQGPLPSGQHPKPPMRREPAEPQPRPFMLSATVVRLDNQPVLLVDHPQTGGTVLGRSSGPVRLIEVVAAGGEGTIYTTHFEDRVCKIYHPQCLTASRRAKLELMVSRDVRIQGVCWPTELVYTLSGGFAGYLMPKAAGKLLKTAVFAKPLLQRTFPHWTRAHLTQLAITVLRTIDRLHRLNVFIGDINPQNILVQDEHRIAIVDVDSFQVEGFPCPVGTETFTPPERQGQPYDRFLRSRDDELFAVTTLLFMILFPGKAPYSSQGGGEALENILNKRFAYGRDADGRPPVGSWQFIWSHLHPGLKDDFTAVFANGGRVPIEHLVLHLQRSMADVRDGRRSDELFPDKPRQREGATVRARCDSCPPDKAEQDISVSLAERLREQGRSFRCSACAALRKIDRLESTRDTDCALRLSPQCHGRAAVSITHLESLKASNRAYWCKACSDAKKQAWAQERTQKQAARAGQSTCFVATATYGSDTAPEVVFLRVYRDAVLRHHRAGRWFIRAYYFIGPWLAAAVQALPALRRAARHLLNLLIARLHRTHPRLRSPRKEETNG